MTAKRNITAGILLTLCIVLILGNDQSRIRKAQFVGRTLYLPLTSSLNYLKNLSEIYENNQYLRRELFLAQNELRQIQKEVEHIENWEELQENIDLTGYDFVVSDVIGTGSFLNYETLTIDGGRNKGIKVNQPVISEKGLVGKTVAVYLNYSVVQTFGNKYFRLGALDRRSRVHGIVKTTLEGKVYFEMIKVGSDLKIDDMIESSKLSSIYPPGIPFGKIVRIEQTSEGLFMRAEIEPFVNLANIESVVVLRAYER
ncbi:MAG TPA: rod shape-determining protein MreC [Candidatus Cloacimonetes bacterium]|nr:rod shape-determining protein MreC [Candidatus Cloacimonadota bacterium]